MAGVGERPREPGDTIGVLDVNRTSYKLGSGTVTVQAATTAYDIDYADINIDVGELAAEDFIKVEMVVVPSDKTIGVGIFAKNTTIEGGIVNDENLIATGSLGRACAIVCQHPSLNDYIVGTIIGHTDGRQITGNIDTNDANVMATAWTLRLTFKNLTGPAAGDTSVRYIATAIKGE